MTDDLKSEARHDVVLLLRSAITYLGAFVFFVFLVWIRTTYQILSFSLIFGIRAGVENVAVFLLNKMLATTFLIRIICEILVFSGHSWFHGKSTNYKYVLYLLFFFEKCIRSNKSEDCLSHFFLWYIDS